MMTEQEWNATDDTAGMQLIVRNQLHGHEGFVLLRIESKAPEHQFDPGPTSQHKFAMNYEDCRLLGGQLLMMADAMQKRGAAN